MEKIGNDETGVFYIERRGYLTVAEKTYVQSALSEDTSTTKFYALIGQIAKETKQTQEKVLDDLHNSEFKKYSKYEDKIFAGMAAMTQYMEIQKMVVATALLNSRVDEEWTVQDTMNELHPDLIDVLKDLYDKEERRSQEALMQVKDELTDDIEVESEEVKE